MKNIRHRTNKAGNREITVELLPGEKLKVFNDNNYYMLGHPLEDVVPGHLINEADPVVWCPINQRWEK